MLVNTRKDHSKPLVAIGGSLFESDQMSSVLDPAKFGPHGIGTYSLSCPHPLRFEILPRRFEKNKKVSVSCS